MCPAIDNERSIENRLRTRNIHVAGNLNYPVCRRSVDSPGENARETRETQRSSFLRDVQSKRSVRNEKCNVDRTQINGDGEKSAIRNGRVPRHKLRRMGIE